jgi:fluoride exporter
MNQFILVAAGGAIGACLRFAINSGISRALGTAFPYGILGVNVAGSFAMGWLIGWLAARGLSDGQVKLFLATGVLGGFTTFSAFSLDAVSLWEHGQMTQSLIYVVASVGCAIAATVFGLDHVAF